MSDDFWMKRALFLANRAFFLKKFPVASVLVYDNVEIAYSFNFFSGYFYHSEILSIKQASFYVSDNIFFKSILYITLYPCFICKNFIIFSKVKKIICAAYLNKINISLNNNVFFIKNNFIKEESIFLIKNFLYK